MFPTSKMLAVMKMTVFLQMRVKLVEALLKAGKIDLNDVSNQCTICVHMG